MLWCDVVVFKGTRFLVVSVFAENVSVFTENFPVYARR
jgi:hypothetical protein